MSRPDTNQRIDLAELGNARRWDAMILRIKNVPPSALTEFEHGFLTDIVSKNENDRPLWSPTRKQWNMLHSIVNGW